MANLNSSECCVVISMSESKFWMWYFSLPRSDFLMNKSWCTFLLGLYHIAWSKWLHARWDGTIYSRFFEHCQTDIGIKYGGSRRWSSRGCTLCLLGKSGNNTRLKRAASCCRICFGSSCNPKGNPSPFVSIEHLNMFFCFKVIYVLLFVRRLLINNLFSGRPSLQCDVFQEKCSG